MISERRKNNEYQRLFKNVYFWRTSRQQEIDYLEEYNGKIYAYEFKWQEIKRVRPPVAFTTVYPGTEFKVIHKDNFLKFVIN